MRAPRRTPAQSTYYLKSSDRWLGRLYQTHGPAGQSREVPGAGSAQLDQPFNKQRQIKRGERTCLRCRAVPCLHCRRARLQPRCRRARPTSRRPQPVQFDGHYYQVVIANKISWEAARAAAEQRSFQGVQGHLATIGSAGRRRASCTSCGSRFWDAPHPSLSGSELWVGGFQVPCATTTPEPACGWMWLNGDPIAPTNSASPYTNWLNGEPNNLKRTPDAMNRATEDFLAIGLKGAVRLERRGRVARTLGLHRRVRRRRSQRAR